MNDFKNFKAKLDEKKGLWDNIHAKRKRGEKPNPPGHPDRPTAQDFKDAQKTSKKESVEEKKLTPAEMKKREEIAKAMERDNPGMDMGKKMAIATAQAKKVAEEFELDEAKVGEKIKFRNIKTKRIKTGIVKKVDIKHGQKRYEVEGGKYVYDSDLEESLDITEISLDMLTKKISNSGMATTKKANKMDKTKNDLAAMKARLAGKPSLAKEEVELDEAQIDKMKFVSKGFDDCQSATRHNDRLVGNKKASHKSYVHKHKNGKFYVVDMKEAKEDDEPASPDEASMALKQLEFIEYAAEEMMDHIKSGKEFPEWFQNKLSKAHGEIEGLHSSMGEHGEDEEDMKEATEVSELSKKTLGSYVKKANADGMSHAQKSAMPSYDQKKHLSKAMSRMRNVSKATDKITKEAVRRKGAPKMTGDSFAMQRAKDAELNKALDRTKTGRKKPVRQMTSTQRSLAQLRREETELDEGISNNMRLISKIKNSGVVKSGSMSKDTKPAPKKEGVNTADRKPEKFIKPDGKIGIRMVPMDKNIVDKDK